MKTFPNFVDQDQQLKNYQLVAKHARQLDVQLKTFLPTRMHHLCHVIYIRQFSLCICAYNPMAASRLKLFSPQILAHFQAQGHAIEQVTIRLLPMNEDAKKPARQPLSAAGARHLNEAYEANKTERPELAELYRRLAALAHPKR